MTTSNALRDTIARPVRAEIEVTRSRFIADLTPVMDVDAAGAAVAAARREFHDARHHCSAWVLGPEGRTSRSNDDGEPAGTAGAPMLAVLQGAVLTDVVAVVTRYFGGTLLGAGGLVRAYGEAVTTALERVTRVSRRQVVLVEVRTDHAGAGRLEHHLRRLVDDLDGSLDGATYDAVGGSFVAAVPAGTEVQLTDALASSGIDHRLELRGHQVRDVRRR